MTKRILRKRSSFEGSVLLRIILHFNPMQLTQEKIPKIQSLFYLVFPWIHQYPCSDESQVWIEPGFFLDYFVQYRKSVIFPALDIKKQASTWIFRKPRGCTLHFLCYPGLVNQSGLLNILIHKCQIWIIYLPCRWLFSKPKPG